MARPAQPHVTASYIDCFYLRASSVTRTWHICVREYITLYARAATLLPAIYNIIWILLDFYCWPITDKLIYVTKSTGVKSALHGSI